jgi:cytochrome c oxidase subunit 2
MVVLMRTMLALAVLVILTGASPGGSVRQDAPDEPRVVDVVAERFDFRPSEIRMAAGTSIRIRLWSDDTAHGFYLTGTDVNVEIPKRGRGETTVTFTPERPGRYTFECSRVCGAGHGFMRGVIVVEAPAESSR